MVPSGDSEILPNSSLGLTIDCPAGSYAISGGDFAPPGVYVNSEGPVGPTGNPPPVTTDNPKWIVAFDNTTNGSVYVEAYAVCES